MTDLQSKLARLKELAGRATPGPWEYDERAYGKRPRARVIARHEPFVIASLWDGESAHAPRDAEFVAACDPDTVRELIQAAERGMEYEKGLREAAQSLITKIDEINASPEYKGVFTCAYVHGMPYTGPMFADEYEALKKALASDPPQGKEEEGHETASKD